MAALQQVGQVAKITNAISWVSEISNECIKDIKVSSFAALGAQPGAKMQYDFSSQILAASSEVLKKILRRVDIDQCAIIFCDVSDHIIEKLVEFLTFGSCNLNDATVGEFNELLSILQIKLDGPKKPEQNNLIPKIKVEIDEDMKMEDDLDFKRVYPLIKDACVQTDAVSFSSSRPSINNSWYGNDTYIMGDDDYDGIIGEPLIGIKGEPMVGFKMEPEDVNEDEWNAAAEVLANGSDDEWGVNIGNIEKKKKKKKKLNTLKSNGLPRKQKRRSKAELEKATDTRHCELCNMLVTKRSALRRHLRTIHKLTLLCKHCDKGYTEQADLDAHIAICMPQHLYSCKHCDSKFRIKKEYKDHLKTHPEAVALDECMCTVCGKVFKSNRNLQDHIKAVHEKVQNFTCTECGQGFAIKRNLQGHYIRKHANPGHKPFMCPLCGKDFSSKHEMGKHHQIVHVDKEFQCKPCELCFENKREQRYHQKIIHEKATVYACDICPKVFLRPDERNKHKRFIHNNEKRYGCDICGMRYKSTTKMDKHMRTEHYDVYILAQAQQAEQAEQRAQAAAAAGAPQEQQPPAPPQPQVEFKPQIPIIPQQVEIQIVQAQ